MVMGVKSGMWREIGDMWGNGERVRVGKIVVVNGCPMLFMFDGNRNGNGNGNPSGRREGERRE